VYRDVSEPAPTSSPRRPPADDAAYWYDLLAEDPAPRDEQARGPFEPLLPSGVPAGAAGQRSSPDPEPEPGRRPASPGGTDSDRQEPSDQARARKLEQLRDLYLTAEAIGEQNVDKHFDQLLAQQRELISEYFRQSPSSQPDATGPGEGSVPGAERDQQTVEPGRAAEPGLGVRARPPRAW